MLNWKVVSKSLASFGAITFVLCVGYGLLVPASVHPAWLLEAMLPGFKWLTLVGFLVGLVEVTIYGAGAGALYAVLYNYFARRAGDDVAARATIPRAA